MDPVIARKTWRTLEPLHGMIYFVPEADESYQAIGLQGNRMGYFASRATGHGPGPGRGGGRHLLQLQSGPGRSGHPAPGPWPRKGDILAARLDAVDRALQRGLGPEVVKSAAVAKAAALARRAAEAAGALVAGRPLFAGHAALPWPEEPHLVLWHAQTLLREYRGDGHVAALMLAGLDPVEALVSHAAEGEVAAGVLRATRSWTAAAWTAAEQRLQQRGLLDAEGAFTAAGRALRQQVEDQTDILARPAYEVLGIGGCERLRQLGRPLSQAVVSGGLLAVDPDRFADDGRQGA